MIIFLLIYKISDNLIFFTMGLSVIVQCFWGMVLPIEKLRDMAEKIALEQDKDSDIDDARNFQIVDATEIGQLYGVNLIQQYSTDRGPGQIYIVFGDIYQAYNHSSTKEDKDVVLSCIWPKWDLIDKDFLSSIGITEIIPHPITIANISY